MAALMTGRRKIVVYVVSVFIIAQGIKIMSEIKIAFH